MSATTVTLKVLPFPKGVDVSQRRLHVIGTASFGASPLTYTTGGIALSWTSLTDSLTGNVVSLDTTATAPIIAWFQSTAGSGYVYGWNSANDTLQIFLTGTAANDPLNELANGTAIPAGVSGDTIMFEAVFPKAI